MFNVIDPPSDAWLDLGSVNMLLAGVSANNPLSFVGALAFDASCPPSRTGWNRGSALSCEYPA